MGCATAGKAALQGKAPIALVSVISNNDINWEGEKPTHPDELLFSKKKLRADPDKTGISSAEDLIVKADEIFIEVMAGSGFVNLADPGTVLLSKAYAGAAEDRNIALKLKSGEMVKPSQYRNVFYRDKNFAESLALETGITSTLYLEFNFTKSFAGGIAKTGNCRALVTMTVKLVDSHGKTIYTKEFNAGSDNTIRAVLGVYSESELFKLFESTIEEVCYMFLDDLE
jgi:hypothetical protein